MRNEYLFDLCDICGVGPRESDHLPVLELMILVKGIQARREMRREMAEKAGVWIP